jgi:hypothetical protein
VALGGPLDKLGQPRSQLRRGLVASLLGQPGVPGNVQEAHRRGIVQRCPQPCRGERAFEVVDDVLEPGVLLVAVIEGEERLIQEGSDLHSPLGGEIQDLAFADSGLDQRPLDFRSPPVRLGLGNPAQAVAVDAQPALNHGCPKPSRKLPLDQLSDASLVLAHMVVRIGLGKADRFTNDHGQL